ncbi:hypothetical protein ACIPSK_30055, partial [Rhizobium sp. LARHSG275]
PSYTPLPHPELYCGVVALNNNQAVILSSFVAPVPNAVMNCIPEQIFFVKMGYQPVGSTVAYDESNAACCDFTTNDLLEHRAPFQCPFASSAAHSAKKYLRPWRLRSAVSSGATRHVCHRRQLCPLRDTP